MLKNGFILSNFLPTEIHYNHIFANASIATFGHGKQQNFRNANIQAHARIAIDWTKNRRHRVNKNSKSIGNIILWTKH